MTDFAEAVERAERRIRDHVRETPVERALGLEDGNEVFLKLENLQQTGSFKLRGVMNKLLAADEETRARGFVVCSTGNHGAASAHGWSVLGCEGIVFVPENASPAKVDAIRARGVEVVAFGDDCVVAEARAREVAQERGLTYISPYNDIEVVHGQGTAAVELARQVDGELDALFVSVGGGGLVSGMAGYLKHAVPSIEIIGVSPANSAVMAHSVEAGEILDLESLPTLSDGTAGGVEAGSVTFDLCRDLVDRFVLVSEDEIRAATREVIVEQHTLIEGAAGAAVAAYQQERERWRGKRVAILLCGANIGADDLKVVLG